MTYDAGRKEADMKPEDGGGGTQTTAGGRSRLPESVVQFVQQEIARLNRHGASEHFQALVPAIERAYMAAHAAIPAVSRARDAAIAHALLLCHRSFLVVASIIGRGHPDDAAGTNRRALEAAKAALAFHYDEANWHEWCAYEKRMKRWKDRQEGRRPDRNFRPQLKLPLDHALLDELGTWLGMLSDTVHFTPEFTGSHELAKRPGELFLDYFTDDAAELDHALRALAAVHIIILRVLDEAFGGAFGRDAAFRNAMAALSAAGMDLARRAGVPYPGDEPQ